MLSLPYDAGFQNFVVSLKSEIYSPSLHPHPQHTQLEKGREDLYRQSLFTPESGFENYIFQEFQSFSVNVWVNLARKWPRIC